MSFYLCGNTGIVNRGCEAIIRSTNKLLSSMEQALYLATYAPSQDREMCKELGINLLEYNDPTILRRIAAKGLRMLGNYTYSEKIRQDNIISKLSPVDICLNIGGDTYCYGKPERAMALNKFAKAKGARTVLWCCSIEDEVIGGEVRSDLARYDFIFVREPLTYQSLINKGLSAERVVKVCDPAFFLDKARVELPPVFEGGSVVGLNVSECVIKNNDKTVYDAVLNFARYLLTHTELNICLIPHVYNIEQNICDWPILHSLMNELNSDRVALIDQELNCEQLKYIISNCRFMVAARTHASIAAYSACVPTMVIGYSVKSKGIAVDLFGTYDNYVVSYEDIHTETDLIKPFSYLMDHESEIRGSLSGFLPAYRQSLTDAIEKYLRI